MFSILGDEVSHVFSPFSKSF